MREPTLQEEVCLLRERLEKVEHGRRRTFTFFILIMALVVSFGAARLRDADFEIHSNPDVGPAGSDSYQIKLFGRTVGPTDRAMILQNQADEFSDTYRLVVRNDTGTEVMCITHDAKMGIGTSNPTDVLHLAGNAGTDGIRFPDGSFMTSANVGSTNAISTTNTALVEGDDGVSYESDQTHTFLTFDGGSRQPRLSITESTGTTHSEIKIENGILRLSSTAPGTNVAAGDIRYDAGVIKYYDGGAWKTLVTSTGNAFVEIGPAAAQTYTGSNALIHLDETGAGSPNLIEVKVAGSNMFVVENDGDIRTDRWLDHDSNTFVGIEAAGDNALTHAVADQGYYNTALGNLALQSITSGWRNTAIGYSSLHQNLAGYDNTAVGSLSLQNNTTGNSNTANGTSALSQNLTGCSNTACGFWALRLNTSGHYNTVSGAGALASNTIGGSNTAFGYQSLNSNVSGNNNVGIGQGALYECTSSDNVAIGYYAATENTNGSKNVAIGRYANRHNQAGNNNVVIGYGAGENSATHTKSNCVLIGYDAGYSNIATGATAIGYRALYWNSTGFYNTALGYEALVSSQTGGYNTAVGYRAGNTNTTGGYNVAVGEYANRYNMTGSNNVILGSEAGQGTSNHSKNNNVIIGHQSGYSLGTGHDGNVAMGYQSLYNGAGDNSVAIGYQAGFNNAASSVTAVGYRSLYANTSGSRNTAVGSDSLSASMTNSDSTAVGYSALRNSTGPSNTAFGSNSLYMNTSGAFNTAVGHDSLRSTSTSSGSSALGYKALYNSTGSSSTALGAYSLYRNTSGQFNLGSGYSAGYNNQTGNCNVFLGYDAGRGAALHSKSNCVLVGYRAGYNLGTGGDGNVMLGYQAGYNETGSNKLYIENSNSTTPLIYGEFDNDCVNINNSLGVNIGTSNPAEKLHVGGPVMLGTTNAPGTTTDRLYNVGGDLYWDGNQIATGPTGGWHGSSTRIKIHPSDFFNTTSTVGTLVDNGTVIYHWTGATPNTALSIPIPEGYTATHVKINGANGATSFTVYEGNVSTGARSGSKGSGNVGTELDITDVQGDSSNFLYIYLSHGFNDQLYGGYVTITKP